jgi:hypothetical protein
VTIEAVTNEENERINRELKLEILSVILPWKGAKVHAIFATDGNASGL